MIINNSLYSNGCTPQVVSAGYASLHQAVVALDVQKVQELLKSGADPFEQDPTTGNTAFHVAASQNNALVISELLKCHIPAGYLEIRNSLNETALHIAAENNAVDVFKALVANGAQLLSRSKKMRTPLHIASAKGHVGIIEQYRGQLVDVKTSDNKTPFYVACVAGKELACRLLLDLGANRWFIRKGMSPLYVAAYYGHESVISLYDRVSPHVEGITALFVACKNGHLGAACQLLVLGEDPKKRCSKDKLSSLHVAVINGRDDIVELFKHNGELREQYTGGGVTALYLACDGGMAAIARQLLDAGSDPSALMKNRLKDTSLHIAAERNFVDVIQQFQSCSKEVLEVVDRYNQTPFMVACSEGNFEAAYELARMGAKIDGVDIDKWNALSLAVADGHSKIISLFLHRKDLLDEALNIAACSDNLECVRELLKAGASIRALPLLSLSYTPRVIDVFVAHMKQRLQDVITLTKQRDCYEEVLEALTDVLFMQARFSHTLKLNSSTLYQLMKRSAKIPDEALQRAYQTLPVHHNRDLSALEFKQECLLLREYIVSTQLKRLNYFTSDKVSGLVGELKALLLSFSPADASALLLHSKELKKRLENNEELKPIVDAFYALNYLIFLKFSTRVSQGVHKNTPAPVLPLSDEEFNSASALEIMQKRYGLYPCELSVRDFFDAGLITGSDLRVIGIDNGFYADNPFLLKTAVIARIKRLEYWLKRMPQYSDNIQYQINCLENCILAGGGTIEELEMRLSNLSLKENKEHLAIHDRDSAFLLLDLFLKGKLETVNDKLKRTESLSLSEYIAKTNGSLF